MANAIVETFGEPDWIDALVGKRREEWQDFKIERCLSNRFRASFTIPVYRRVTPEYFQAGGLHSLQVSGHRAGIASINGQGIWNGKELMIVGGDSKPKIPILVSLQGFKKSAEFQEQVSSSEDRMAGETVPAEQPVEWVGWAFWGW